MNKEKKDIISAELERIAAKNGGILTPDIIKKEAKSPKSPIHDQFDWDDSVAAEKWRTQQARQLIRSVKIEIKRTNITLLAPAYVEAPDKEPRNQGYRPTEEVKKDVDMARAAMTAELKAAWAYLTRAERLAEALGLLDETRSAMDALDIIRRRLEADAA